MKVLVLLGRVFFSLIFIISSFHHFSDKTISYAASQHVPLPAIIVPISGVIALLGGLSVLFGFKARAGAWLLIIFLIPVTLFIHSFWNFTDPMMRSMQMSSFMKNISMLGGALIIAYFGAGPLSFDNIRRRVK